MITHREPGRGRVFRRMISTARAASSGEMGGAPNDNISNDNNHNNNNNNNIDIDNMMGFLGVWLLGAAFWRGLSIPSGCHCTDGHLTSKVFAEDQTNIVECRPPLGALPLSPTRGASWLAV